jgi:hypothetical protein
MGGPFKVGYSKHPDKRAKEIVKMWPGSQYRRGRPILWEVFPVADLAIAQAAERDIHGRLSRSQVRSNPEAGWTTEWFDAPFGRIRSTVARVIARHNGTSFRVAMSKRLLTTIDKWRSKQPDTPSISIAIERLMTAAMDRDDAALEEADIAALVEYVLTSDRPRQAA